MTPTTRTPSAFTRAAAAVQVAGDVSAHARAAADRRHLASSQTGPKATAFTPPGSQPASRSIHRPTAARNRSTRAAHRPGLASRRVA